MRRAFPICPVLFWMVTAGIGMCQDIFVQSAFYGRGGYGVDVTSQVQELANRDGAVYVSNETFGGDPLPGRRKYLAVTYIVGGQRFTERAEENQTLRFRMPESTYYERQPRGVYQGRIIRGPEGRPYGGYEVGRRVVRAVYGTHGRYVDVTATVQRLAADGVKFEVSNETFGFDPYKGHGKKLKVTFEENGETFEKEYDEGDHVRL
ncbi:MAG: hypothetical protein JO015_00640 [Verrucomicrobia bacterium]|nr:hypothetical protein [Verrucomicrobiota bacterium]